MIFSATDVTGCKAKEPLSYETPHYLLISNRETG